MHTNSVSYILDVYVHAMVWEGWKTENTAKQSRLHGAHGLDGPVLARLLSSLRREHSLWDRLSFKIVIIVHNCNQVSLCGTAVCYNCIIFIL